MIFGLNYEDGYIVKVHMIDEKGLARWFPLRNFGERQGDARIYREEDCPKLTDSDIRMTIRSYKKENKYIRLGFKKYRKQ